eukprot:8197261-Lingulodinium_polyedra.AAC.1
MLRRGANGRAGRGHVLVDWHGESRPCSRATRPGLPWRCLRPVRLSRALPPGARCAEGDRLRAARDDDSWCPPP